jgi:hypothetical protein
VKATDKANSQFEKTMGAEADKIRKKIKDGFDSQFSAIKTKVKEFFMT